MPVTIGSLKLFTVEEVAETLDVRAETIRDYLRRGKLVGNRIGVKWYVSEDTLRAFFERPGRKPRKR